MTIVSWKLWLIPFAFWGVYLCWNSGYQSGYAEGHQTAWRMSRSIVVVASTESPSEREDDATSPEEESKN